MKKQKSLVEKMLLLLGGPVVILLILMLGIIWFTVNQYPENSQTVILITGVIGIISILGIIIFGTKQISKKVSDLITEVERFIIDDLNSNSTHQSSSDQLDELSVTISNLIEKFRTYSIFVKTMANGDLSVAIDSGIEQDDFISDLVVIRDSTKRFETDTAMLIDLAKKDIFDKRDLANDLKGDFKKAILNANAVMDIVVDKIFWYRGILDAIPFPVHVIDNNMNWVFLNKVFLELMIANGVVTDLNDACGKACSSANATICNTKNCGIRQLVDNGITETYFEWVGRNNKQDTAYLLDKDGEKVGYVEIVTDLTSIVSVSDYTNTEVKRLANNLMRLADGDLNFDMQIEEAGEYTVDVSNQFHEIGENLNNVKNSIGNLIDDATLITDAAIEGNLDVRADAYKFNGSWKSLVEGMNNILDEIAKPLREVANVMNEMSNGYLEVSITGDYHGEFDILKKSVNYTASTIKNIVDEIAVVTKKIADGDFSQEHLSEFNGDFKTISDSLNVILDSLGLMLGKVNDSAEQVTAGSTQVADASQALAQGSTEQASSIQELTASISEIADQTKNNAVNANQARDLTLDVQEHAKKGNVQMSEMQKSMLEINKSSENISKIIKVIDDIAFQTNILALNAAVEAARAGQHGKGFAVVAEEVRTLAARSAEAAKETTVLIEGSIEKVASGTNIADQTANALNEIVTGIEKVTNLVANIAEASNEQASGIAQINVGVEQVAQVVQNNSATAEQSAAASEELSTHAELLKEMMRQFKVKR